MTFQQQADTGFDHDRALAFAGRMSDFINSGAVAVMASIGHRTGLFDAMAGRAPSTSAEIAAASGLAERYVREWLAVMVTGGVVTYDPAGGHYHLPAEHAASLTRGAPLGNLAVYAQHVALMGQVQERILHCFATGEGAAYADYPDFHRLMAEDSDQTVVDQLDTAILPLAGDLPERLAAGIDVLDAGCGRGRAVLAMARKYPRSRFLGLDFCADAIEDASSEAAARGLGNVHFEVRDMTDFAAEAAFDLVTSFDAVHDQKHPGDFLRRLHRALRPGGIHLMQDIGGSARLEANMEFPMAPLLYAVSCLHCMPVSLGQGGEGLGTMWGWETAERMLREAGHASVSRHVLPHDPMNVWFVSRKA